ncbi:hypothetical protein [Streptomyces collinus]
MRDLLPAVTARALTDHLDRLPTTDLLTAVDHLVAAHLPSTH